MRNKNKSYYMNKIHHTHIMHAPNASKKYLHPNIWTTQPVSSYHLHSIVQPYPPMIYNPHSAPHDVPSLDLYIHYHPLVVISSPYDVVSSLAHPPPLLYHFDDQASSSCRHYLISHHQPIRHHYHYHNPG